MAKAKTSKTTTRKKTSTKPKVRVVKVKAKTAKTGKSKPKAKKSNVLLTLPPPPAHTNAILVAGLSLSEIGRRTGAGQSYISKLHRGVRTPSVSMIEKLMLATGLDRDLVMETFAKGRAGGVMGEASAVGIAAEAAV